MLHLNICDKLILDDLFILSIIYHLSHIFAKLSTLESVVPLSLERFIALATLKEKDSFYTFFLKK